MRFSTLSCSKNKSLDDLGPDKKISSSSPGIALSDVSDDSDDENDPQGTKSGVSHQTAVMVMLGPVIEAFRRFFGEREQPETSVADNSQISLGEASASESNNGITAMDLQFIMGQGQQRAAYAVQKDIV